MIKTIQNDKKLPFFSLFYHFIFWIGSFLSLKISFIVSFLSSLNKKKYKIRSKQYRPFIDFRRSLVKCCVGWPSNRCFANRLLVNFFLSFSHLFSRRQPAFGCLMLLWSSTFVLIYLDRCKNAEKEDVDQCTMCNAPLPWTKYTTGKDPKMIPKPLKDPLKHILIEKLGEGARTPLTPLWDVYAFILTKLLNETRKRVVSMESCAKEKCISNILEHNCTIDL